MPRERVQRESDKAAAEHENQGVGMEHDGRPTADDKAAHRAQVEARKAEEAEREARIEAGVPVNPPEPESGPADVLLPEVDGPRQAPVNPPEAD